MCRMREMKTIQGVSHYFLSLQLFNFTFSVALERSYRSFAMLPAPAPNIDNCCVDVHLLSVENIRFDSLQNTKCNKFSDRTCPVHTYIAYSAGCVNLVTCKRNTT